MRIITYLAVGLALAAMSACGGKADFKESSYPAWGFAASFQAPPKVTETKGSADGSQPHTLMVEAKGAGHDFAVTAIDASSSTGTTDQILDNASQAFAKAGELDIGSTTHVAAGAVGGREIRFDRDSKPVMLMRIFLAGGRFYEVSADTPKGLNDPDVKTFLDSFKLLGDAANPAPPPAANAADNAAPANTAANAPS